MVLRRCDGDDDDGADDDVDSNDDGGDCDGDGLVAVYGGIDDDAI